MLYPHQHNSPTQRGQSTLMVLVTRVPAPRSNVPTPWSCSKSRLPPSMHMLFLYRIKLNANLFVVTEHHVRTPSLLK